MKLIKKHQFGNILDRVPKQENQNPTILDGDAPVQSNGRWMLYDSENDEFFGGQLDPTYVTATYDPIDTPSGKRTAQNFANKVLSGQLTMNDIPDIYKNWVDGEVRGAQPVRDAINTTGVQTALGALAVPASIIGGAELGGLAGNAWSWIMNNPGLSSTIGKIGTSLLTGATIDQGFRQYTPWSSVGDAVIKTTGLDEAMDYAGMQHGDKWYQFNPARGLIEFAAEGLNPGYYSGNMYGNLAKSLVSYTPKPKMMTVIHRSPKAFNIEDFNTGTVNDFGLHAGTSNPIFGDYAYELKIPKPDAKTIDIGANGYEHLMEDYIFPKQNTGFFDANPADKKLFLSEYFRNRKNWGSKFPKFEDIGNNHIIRRQPSDFHFNLRRRLTKGLTPEQRQAFNIEADDILRRAQALNAENSDMLKIGMSDAEAELKTQLNKDTASLLHKYGMDVIKYPNANFYEGNNPAYIITDPSVIRSHKLIYK